ncbi:MAG: hypothetical protein WKG06_21475 [Segetibacter sp.]
MKKAALISILLCIFNASEAQSLIDTVVLGRELEDFGKKLDSATVHKDSILLDKLISKSFLRIHGTNGAIELRKSWMNGILKGSPISQDTWEDNFNKSIKYPTTMAAIKQAIVRRRTSIDQREIWLYRSDFYAKDPTNFRFRK